MILSGFVMSARLNGGRPSIGVQHSLELCATMRGMIEAHASFFITDLRLYSQILRGSIRAASSGAYFCNVSG